MPTLSQAPLVEVVTQIRWGSAERDEGGQVVRYVFSERDGDNLLQALESAVIAAGFGVVERIALDSSDAQFTPARAYRVEPDSWPVIQAGLGTFSIHQQNDGYSWATYKADVLRCVEDILVPTLGRFYEHIPVPFIGVELSYLDGFSLGADDIPYQFLKKTFAVEVAPPPDFYAAPFVVGEPASASLGLDFYITEPKGVLSFDMEQEDVLGRPGYTMDTRVLSVGPAVDYTRAGLEQWLELAHRVQQHTFRTLIQPAYLKSLQ